MLVEIKFPVSFRSGRLGKEHRRAHHTILTVAYQLSSGDPFVPPDDPDARLHTHATKE
jgi:hypothetical protein